MRALFRDLLSQDPVREEEGVSFFGGEEDGDCFEEEDVRFWEEGGLTQNWSKSDLADRPAGRALLAEIARKGGPVIDLASGPGLGFLPAILRPAPEVPCLALDASPAVLLAWSRWFRKNGVKNAPDLAAASLFRLPFRDSSVGAYTSFIGISSTRSGEEGYAAALAEIRRTLRADGAVYAVENEFEDLPGILRLFEKAGKEPWDVFREEDRGPWRKRFEEAGFRTESESCFLRRRLTGRDNELGRIAGEYGADVFLRFSAFVLRKR
ncbi:MAG: class I SAM-dependent methyltransferase [Clostridia bacterium]|nr:class I SAM-dependent methyltransferase [Clostridia bacterium]